MGTHMIIGPFSNRILVMAYPALDQRLPGVYFCRMKTYECTCSSDVALDHLLLSAYLDKTSCVAFMCRFVFGGFGSLAATALLMVVG